MESYLVFDPGVVVVKQVSGAASPGKLVPQPGDPELLTSHVVPISPDGRFQLRVDRVLGDGNAAVPSGFREERDPVKAVAEAAAGKLVLRLGTPW